MALRGAEVAPRETMVKHREPARGLLPDLELPDLPEHVAGHVLDEEPVTIAVGIDRGAVEPWRAELGGSEQCAIRLDLAQGVVQELWLRPPCCAVEGAAAQALEHEAQLRAVGEADVELIE